MSDAPAYHYVITAPVAGRGVGDVLTDAKEIAGALAAGWPIIRILAPTFPQEQ